MFNSVKLNIVAVTNRILLDKLSRDIGCSNNGGDTAVRVMFVCVGVI